MASIALCPRCSSHLELPTGAPPTSHIECPVCEAEFLLASVAPRIIPKARLLDATSNSLAEPMDEESCIVSIDAAASADMNQPPYVPQSTPAASDNLSRLLASTSAAQPPYAKQQPASHEQDGEVPRPFHFERRAEERLPADLQSQDSEPLDVAYEDADPALAQQESATGNREFGGSRLDQLLSDLLKTPSPADAARPDAASAANRSSTPSIDDDAKRKRAVLAEEFNIDEADEAIDDEAETAGIGETLAAIEDRWDPTIEEPLVESEEAAIVEQDLAGLNVVAFPRRRRRSAPLRTLAGVVGGGAIGILGGAYCLLWLRGADGDLIGMSRWLPSSMLPSALAESKPDASSAITPTPPSTLVIDEPGETPAESAPLPNDGEPMAANDPASAVRPDSAVMPAAHEEAARSSEPPIETDGVAQAAVETVENSIDNPAPAHSTAWPTTPIVGEIEGATFYSLAELASALAGADAAHRRFLEGDLSRKADVADMGKAYIELCSLAERFTLADPAEFSNELVTKQMNAKQIFRGLVGDPARRSDLAMIAGRWLQHDRRQNQGAVLLGRIVDARAEGPWTEYAVETPLGGTTAVAAVLVDSSRLSIGDDVAVVGVIVPNPRQAIAGYEGDSPQVVVAGCAFTPEDYAAPPASAPSDLLSIGQ